VELALNLVWVVIAALILIAGGARALSLSERRQSFVAFTALVCLVALLFPVISMSDDLNRGVLYVPGGKLKAGISPQRHLKTTIFALLLVPNLTPASWRELSVKPGCSLGLQTLSSSNLERRPPPEVF